MAAPHGEVRASERGGGTHRRAPLARPPQQSASRLTSCAGNAARSIRMDCSAWKGGGDASWLRGARRERAQPRAARRAQPRLQRRELVLAQFCAVQEERVGLAGGLHAQRLRGGAGAGGGGGEEDAASAAAAAAAASRIGSCRRRRRTRPEAAACVAGARATRSTSSSTRSSAPPFSSTGTERSHASKPADIRACEVSG